MSSGFYLETLRRDPRGVQCGALVCENHVSLNSVYIVIQSNSTCGNSFACFFTGKVHELEITNWYQKSVRMNAVEF